jgi:hypothetical protein
LAKRELPSTRNFFLKLLSGETGAMGSATRFDKLADFAFAIQQETIGSAGIFPVRSVVVSRDPIGAVKDAAQTPARLVVSGDRRCIATPPVIFDPRNHPGSQGIQIDIGSHRQKRFVVALHQQALEAILP